MRMLLASLLLPVVLLAADGIAAPYSGRPIAEVIDEFRAQGEPFAYSTNLVGSELVVTVEPDADAAPIEVVRQILRPHGLTIRSDSGVYLVVRYENSGFPGGNLLLVLIASGSERPVTDAQVELKPAAGRAQRLAPGIVEFSGLGPGRYRIDVTASGLEPLRRFVDVWSGDTAVISVGMQPAKPEIETIAVSASRYEISGDIASSRFSIDQRTVRNMPDVGEDPVRAMQRLPGAAASGASAKAHFRGGEDGEIGIMLNGLRLFDPFHMRDYQSVFSAIDSRAIEGVEVYTGGFPVRFGDRMSGLVLMETLDPLTPRHTEIGVSVFNTSILTAGSTGDDRWLFSARRGNLDLVIDPSLGQPRYYDTFAQYEHDFSADTTLSINALVAEDSVELILESDPTELEQVVSDTRNAQLWVQLENRWSAELRSRLLLSAVNFENARVGSLNDTQKIVASVADERRISQVGLRQDWTWTRSDAHLLQWGLEASHASADYAYSNAAEYFELQALYRDQPASSSRALTAAPEGGSYALYFADRWRISPRAVLEWGLRWDDQTYDNLPSGSQLSPRLSLLRTLGPKTDLRLSWGRYYQSQAISELQIEDGVTNFWPAQRADQYIAGIRHLFRDNYALRVEIFHKDMRKLRPRFENLFDPLGLIPEIQPDRVRLDPLRAHSTGVELSIDRSSGPLTWWASYTWSKASDDFAGRSQRRSWDQPHAFQGGMTWSNEKWDVALATSVHSGWPATTLTLVEDGVDGDGEPVLAAVPGERNALRHATFASLDIRVSRKWKLDRGSLTAFIEISNLTNRRNECCLDWDLEQDPATGDEMLEYSYDYWLPLLPAVGILWEF